MQEEQNIYLTTVVKILVSKLGGKVSVTPKEYQEFVNKECEMVTDPADRTITFSLKTK